MNPSELRLWIDTIRHLRPSQVLYRGKERIHRIRSVSEGKAAHRRLTVRRLKLGIEFEAPQIRETLEKLAARRLANRPNAWRLQHPESLTFLSESLSIGIPPVWKEGSQLRKAKDRALWMFHLHYHDWLWDLYSADWRQSIQACLSDWIDENTLGVEHSFRGPWSPYTISRRLPNWCLLLSLPILTGRERIDVAESLVEQAIYLHDHLEWEHGANHLLENLLSLAFVGPFLSGNSAARMSRRNLRYLLRELSRQVLKDGMHEERCPGYHARILSTLEELIQLYAALHHPATARLKGVAVRMRRVDRAWRHPDGLLPLLGDTVLKGAPLGLPSTVPALQRIDEHVVYTDHERRDHLVFDGASMGADHCGAHMHNDLLGFELSLSGRRIVSDGGGGHYGEGAQRDALRSAREHATITVNELECGEPWKSFRMGRRGRVVRLRVAEKRNGPIEIIAAHTGFEPCGVLHERRIQIVPTLRQYRITDRLLPMKNRKASENLAIRVLLPLFPGLSLEQDSDKSFRILGWEKAVARITVESHLQGYRVREESGFVYEDFGVPRERVILVLEGQTLLEAGFTYSIAALD